MRKLLIVLFLLLITTFGVVGYYNTSHSDSIIDERDLPSNTEIIN